MHFLGELDDPASAFMEEVERVLGIKPPDDAHAEQKSFSLHDDPDFLRTVGHLATAINRIVRLRTVVHALLHKVRDMNQEVTEFRSTLAALQSSQAALISEVQTLSAKHDTVSASHEAVSTELASTAAELTETKAALVDATSQLKTMSDADDAAVTAAKAIGSAPVATGEQAPGSETETDDLHLGTLVDPVSNAAQTASEDPSAVHG